MCYFVIISIVAVIVIFQTFEKIFGQQPLFPMT